MSITKHAVRLGALTLLAACAAPDPAAQAAASAAAARDAILARHDLDHDGRVLPEEYDRGAGSFAYLDRDGDGAITAADFSARVPMPPRFAVPMTLIRTFGGPQAETLAWTQLEAGFVAMDADADGRLARTELEDALAAQQAPSGPDRFGPLAAAVDTDGDGLVALDELRVDFAARDLDGNGVLEHLERARSGPAPRVGWFAAGDREPAPDFSLPRVEGDGRVTLSALRGRPVVLIFGSFS
jgi:Ca2+-binding EF-hand superfamily protein